MLLEDSEYDDGMMNGKKTGSGKFAGSFRRFLMREHLGLLQEDKDSVMWNSVRDPVCDDFFRDVWLETASTNTKCFDDAFLVVPTDEVRTMEECQKYEKRAPLAEFDRGATNRILSRVKVRGGK